MKNIILIVALLIGVGIFVINYRTTPTDIDLAVITDGTDDSDSAQSQNNYEDFDSSKHTFILNTVDYKFTGYGPAGKQHVGIIDSKIENNNQIYFDMATVKTDNEQLDKHLCTEDFFNCTGFPQSTFVLNSINPISENSARITGVYEMKGISKNISFVAETINDSENLSVQNLSADYRGRFMLDTTEFGFKVPIVDPNVLIEFDFSITAEKIAEVSEETPAISATSTIE